MSQFCDVALPVPVDSLFTYAFGEAAEPVVGGRVLVPFRQEQMQGVVVRVHSDAAQLTQTKIKSILRVVDAEPVLSAEQLKLATWIAEYYLSPLGEVLRSMLPLQAEIRQRTL